MKSYKKGLNLITDVLKKDSCRHLSDSDLWTLQVWSSGLSVVAANEYNSRKTQKTKESVNSSAKKPAQQLKDSISLKNEVFEWLGFSRDYMRPEDVKSLQKILKRSKTEIR